MRRGLRPGVLPLALAACLLLAAASLLVRHTLAYDPWAWMVWGREVLHGSLDTGTGPSWKPAARRRARRAGRCSAAAERLLLGTARPRELLLDTLVIEKHQQAVASQATFVGLDDLLGR